MLRTLRYFHLNPFAYRLSKKIKRGTPWNYGLSSSSSHSHLKGSWHPERTPSRPGALVAPQGAPLIRRLRTASSLMQTAPYTEFSYMSTTRSIRDRTHLLRLAYRLCYRLIRVHLTVMDRVTVQEAAQRLGISQDAVRQRIRRGSMKHDKDDKGPVYEYLNPTNTRPTPVHDAPRGTLYDASRSNELVTELRNRIQFLETELADRKDHIIAALTQRIPELEPAPEPREYSERPAEHVDRSAASTNESRRPQWAFLLGELVSASRRVRGRVRRG